MTAHRGTRGTRATPQWLLRTEPEVRPLVWRRHDREPPAASPPAPEAESAEGADVIAASERVCALERALSDAETAASEARADAESARAELERLRAHESELRAEAVRARAELGTFAADTLRDAERELVRLATALAKRVVGRELATEPALIVAWAREAIAQSSMGRALVIAVSKDIAAQLDGDAWGELGPHTLVDDELPAETCELRGGATAVTLSGTNRLDLVVESVAQEQEREAA